MTVVFFTAAWCSACKGIKPNIISVCNAMGIILAIVDVDATPDMAIRHNVSSLPTIVIELDGVEVDRIVGSVGRNEFQHRLILAKGA